MGGPAGPAPARVRRFRTLTGRSGLCAVLWLAVAAIGPAMAEPRVQPDLPAKPEAKSPPLDESLRETIVRRPVTVRTRDGREHRADMIVTHFRPPGDGPFPAVVLNHGRGPLAKRFDIPRFRTTPAFWTRRGFAVLVLTRVGYGEAGQGLDPESAGSCSAPDYEQPASAILTQTSEALALARELPWIDSSRIVLIGQSYGGFGTIKGAARSMPGVVAAINFVGGVGGRPDHRPGEPCDGAQVTRLYAEAGRTTRVPTLWLYAENDRYWGAEWPRKWAMAFEAAGGPVEFHMLPAVGEDGHELRAKALALWRPIVDRFLERAGFPAPRTQGAPPSTGFAPLDTVEKVPHVNDKGREGYRNFLASDVPRAFAVAPSGAWAWRSGSPAAAEEALARCNQTARVACKLYAVDDDVVWSSSPR